MGKPFSACGVTGCDRQSVTCGLCQAHYKRLRKNGVVGPVALKGRSSHKKTSRKTCSHPDCERPHYGHGFCESHYKTSRRHRKIVLPFDRKCDVDVCDKLAEHRGYCPAHQRQWRLYGCASNMPVGKRGHAYGTGITYIHGYRLVDAKGHPNKHPKSNKIMEHRLIMSQHLGRPLLKHETPHHKNGQRADNRIENLELWSSAQPPGQRIADKVAFAVEMLNLYTSPEQRQALMSGLDGREDEPLVEHRPIARPAALA